MKKIVCELCGSNDLKKKDGEYECQYCGTKYSIEEAKKLIVEGKVKIDKSDDIANYIEMCNNSLAAGNYNEAYEFANKILETNAKCVDGWIGKIRACCKFNSTSDLRIKDILAAGKNAISYSKEKDNTQKIVYSCYLMKVFEVLKYVTDLYSDHTELNKAFDKFYKEYYGTAKDRTKAFDANNLNLYESLTGQAIDLLNQIPASFFSENTDQALQLIECAKQYKYMCFARKNRCKIYGTQILKHETEHRNLVITSMYNCAINAIRTTDPSFNVEIELFEGDLIDKKLIYLALAGAGVLLFFLIIILGSI